ncbi:hypothetical protein L204_104785 [Cryptococcus depauperatus]
MSNFLGRPSGGDSPFAIGDRAMKDTSNPQPPQQHNPTPRNQYIPESAHPGYPPPRPSPYQEQPKSYPVSNDGRGGMTSPNLQGRGYTPQQHFVHSGPPPGGGAQGYGGRPGSQQGYAQAAGTYQQAPSRQYSSPPPQQGYPQQQSQNFAAPRPTYPQQGYADHPPTGDPSLRPAQQQQYGSVPQQPPHYNPATQGSHPQPTQQEPWGEPHTRDIPTTAPQSNDDYELVAMFNQFDSTKTGQLMPYDLQRLLAKDARMAAREDSIKMLMNIFDTDRSGSINYHEFEGLYRYIQDWHNIFARFDRDSSGLIDRSELHSALLGFGFALPPELIRKVEKRFAPPPGQGENKGIGFDRFLMACVTVKHYTEGFTRFDQRNEGRVTMDYNQFMEMVLDAPS